MEGRCGPLILREVAVARFCAGWHEVDYPDCAPIRSADRIQDLAHGQVPPGQGDIVGSKGAAWCMAVSTAMSSIFLFGVDNRLNLKSQQLLGLKEICATDVERGDSYVEEVPWVGGEAWPVYAEQRADHG